MSTDQPIAGKYAVLYVDDEEQALKYFRRGLEKDFRIFTATGAAAAIEILEKEASSLAVVITDQRMPGKSGVALLSEVRERWPAIVRILVTAYTDIDSAVAAVNAGAVYKYVNKPADFPLLRQILTEAVSVYRETIHRDELAETVRELEAQKKATQEAEAKKEQLQQKLLAASRDAGRAEVATGILHNVGNVLNSMNVSAGVVNETLEHSRVGNLMKGLSMLEEHSEDLASFLTNDDRGMRLPTYLIKLAGVLEEERQAITNAMMTLSRNIEHIGQVVRVQQSYAKDIVLRQPMVAAELMDDAIRVNQGLIDQNNVQVTRDYGTVPVAMLDQHSVLQILINLISNAARAASDISEARSVILRIKVISSDAGSRLVFDVVDNGSGIAPENLTKIFTYGFTTRKEGHGFGLHSAANSAREMGGSLTAASEGPGKGATFSLELPLILEQDDVRTTSNEMQELSV